MAAGIKTGGRQKGSRNKPKAPPAPPAPAAAAAPPDPQPEPRAHAREKTAAGSGFPPYRLKRVDSLVPYERNARTHTPEQIDKLCRLIGANGWTNPILVAGNDILAGHARHAAAIKLGLDRVPTIDLSHLSDQERRAVILSDNRSALDAGWDNDMLAIELGELRDGGFDMALTGFDMAEIGALFGNGAGGLTDPDEAPPLRPDAVSRTADVWLLGAHRLMCGDCTQPEDVALAMAGARAVLMNTDPPYGVDYAAVKDGMPGSGFKHMQRDGGDIANDDLTDGAVLQAFLESAIRAAVPQLIDRAAFYFWHPMLTQGTFFAAAAAAAADILIHRQIIWVKPHMVLTRSGMYHWRHELCFYGWRRGKMPAWHGNKSQTSVWDDLRQDGVVRGHPTQKPVELFERPILNHTKKGAVVYEPFCGSGSQIIAAEMTGRICHAIEIEPRYVDVAIRRWQAFAGQAATLEGDGRTFDTIEAERTTPAAAEPPAASAPAPRARRAKVAA